MAENRGKQFETQIKNAFERIEGVSIDRLIDPMAGYAGIRNICDFIVYKKPYQYYIECKSHRGSSLPFTCITDNQWKGMLEKSYIYGVKAGVIMWFIDKDVTVFVPIQVLEQDRLAGKKSWRFDDERAIQIPGKKKRVFFDYFISVLFEE